MARPKGATNHQSKAIKDMILAAFDDIGGKDYLVAQATENPVAFMTLLGKVIPREVEMEVRQSAIEQIAQGVIEHESLADCSETEG